MTKKFTLEELAKFDGKEGRAAYIARKGIVYDMSSFQGWANGQHHGGAKAGIDVTAIFEKSPHDPAIFDDVLPVVGELVE